MANIKIKVAGVWRKAPPSVKVAGVWKEASAAFVKVSGVWRESFKNATTVSISGNVGNYNLFYAMGGPTSPGNYIVTIQPGVLIYSTSTLTPAFDTGALPAGSSVLIINKGSIIGMGGAGGYSIYVGDYFNNSASVNSGQPGGAGGPALRTSTTLTVNNTSGYIFGGGGGGGGGGGVAFYCFPHHCPFILIRQIGGGGGGGGAGNNGGAGGAKGAFPSANYPEFPFPGSTAGGPGSTAGGTAGSGSTNGGQAGGAGGGYGAWGAAGAAGAGVSTAGGAAGKAIALNGNPVAWLGGNNSTQVKGAVN
jgi:hypothetical protein